MLKFQNFTRHFLANSADRPEICATIGGIMQWIMGRSAEFAQKWLVNFQTSNGSKILRIAPILTILGWNRSRRSVLFFQKFSRHQNFASTKKIVKPIRTEISARPIRDRGPDRTGFWYRSDGPDEHRSSFTLLWPFHCPSKMCFDSFS